MLVLASSAMAEHLMNDEQGSPTRVDAIGYTQTIDTIDATTALEDPDCYGHGTTVWYWFTPDEATFIDVNTIGSDYDTTLSVYVTGVDGLMQIACNDDIETGNVIQSRIRFEAQAGVAYLFMVGSYESALQDALGGSLTFNLQLDPPPPQSELAIDSLGSVFPRAGSAALRGTVTCTRPADVSIDGWLKQRAGRFLVEGSSSTAISCDGTTPWSLEVMSYNGRFAGGRADASVFAISQGEDYKYSTTDFESASVRLTG